MEFGLRKWRLSDAKELAAALNNRHILNNLRDGLPFPYTEQDARDYIIAMLSANENDTFAYAITMEDRPIGSIGAFRQGNIHRQTAELGYLQTLPAQLGCAYAGTLIKGDMFGLGLMDEKNRVKLLAPFAEMGRYYAKTGYFDKPSVDEFSAPEYMPPSQIRMYNMVFRHISRLFMGRMAKKLGCKGRLDDRPYAEHVR